VASNDFQNALVEMAWAFRLLPVLVLGIIAYLRRGQLRKPLAFWILGVLSFYGVAWVVSQFAWNWRFNLMTSTVGDELAVAVLSSALIQFGVSSALSIIPLAWLYRLLVRAGANA
jgi:hypothetical protein